MQVCVCTRWRLFLDGRWCQRLVWQQVLQVFHHLISAVLVVSAILLLISSLIHPQTHENSINFFNFFGG